MKHQKLRMIHPRLDEGGIYYLRGGKLYEERYSKTPIWRNPIFYKIFLDKKIFIEMIPERKGIS